MATITNTLITGLSQQMVQARLEGIDASQFYFGKYFPVRKVNGFIWQTLVNQLAKKNVAADLHTDNGTILRKKRPIFESAKGDIPFISISREMKRSEIKDYQTARALAQDASALELVQYWGEDVDFVFNGVQSELEYIAWACLTGACKLSFTSTNNATFASEFDLDYQVEDGKKKVNSTSWENVNADIIGDLRGWVKDAKDLGLNPKYLFINLDNLYNICSSNQIIKACASYIANATQMAQTPTFEQVNQMLAKQAWLNGVQLRVIDQTITREMADGTQTAANPFADDVAILSETERLGSTQYDILEDSNESVIRSVRSHTVVKKYGTAEPMSEVTIGETDAVPVIDTAYRNLYCKTNAVSW